MYVSYTHSETQQLILSCLSKYTDPWVLYSHLKTLGFILWWVTHFLASRRLGGWLIVGGVLVNGEPHGFPVSTARVQSFCGLGHTGVDLGCLEALCSCLPLSPVSLTLCSQILTWPWMNPWITSPRPWGRRLNCTAESLEIHLPPSAGSKMMRLWSRNPGGSPSGQPIMALGCGLETWTPQTQVTSSAWRPTARRWFLLLESCLSSLVSSLLLGMGLLTPWGWRGREWAYTENVACAQHPSCWFNCTHFTNK